MTSSMRRVLWLAPLFLSLVAVGSAQTTWHVDVKAQAPGNGTPGSPYTSIQHAIDQPTTLDGDTLLVYEGTYVEHVTYTKALTIRSRRGPEVTFIDFPPDGVPGNPLVRMQLSGKHTTLEGFTLRTSWTGVFVYNADAVGTIKRCILINLQPTVSPGSEGVEAENTTEIIHCTLSGWGTAVSGTFPFDCWTVKVSNSLFEGNLVDLSLTTASGCVQGFASHCAFQQPPVGHWSVTQGVIGIPPGVWDADLDDFHLKPLSPCIDTGNPNLPPDPDGSIADIGAIRYKPNYAATPTNYCAGKVHSGGCAARIQWSGTPSLSGPDDFVISTELSLNKMLGNFIWSQAPQLTPFAGGNLCIAAPVTRAPVISSGGNSTGGDCSGKFVWPVTQTYMQQHGWTPGTILYAQAWGRDTGFSPPENSQLSDAVVFMVQP